jgi:hypothetical protein
VKSWGGTYSFGSSRKNEFATGPVIEISSFNALIKKANLVMMGQIYIYISSLPLDWDTCPCI